MKELTSNGIYNEIENLIINKKLTKRLMNDSLRNPLHLISENITLIDKETEKLQTYNPCDNFPLCLFNVIDSIQQHIILIFPRFKRT